MLNRFLIYKIFQLNDLDVDYILVKHLSIVYDNADPPEARVRLTERDHAVYYTTGGQVKGDNIVYYNTVE